MQVDMWYRNEKATDASCTFYPNEGIYRGNFYNKDGKPIGDYSSRDSVEMSKRLSAILGKEKSTR